MCQQNSTIVLKRMLEMMMNMTYNQRKEGQESSSLLNIFFLVMCRHRRGSREQHLAHLFGVSQSNVSRVSISWITYMYLKFGQINIWSTKDVVLQTMPESFKQSYPTTRIIIDCTEIRVEMPSSLLVNTELFSSYKKPPNILKH